MEASPLASLEQNCTLLINNDDQGSFDLQAQKAKLMDRDVEVDRHPPPLSLVSGASSASANPWGRSASRGELRAGGGRPDAVHQKPVRPAGPFDCVLC